MCVTNIPSEVARNIFRLGFCYCFSQERLISRNGNLLQEKDEWGKIPALFKKEL